MDDNRAGMSHENQDNRQSLEDMRTDNVAGADSYTPRRRAPNPATQNTAFARRDTSPPLTSRPGDDPPYARPSRERIQPTDPPTAQPQYVRAGSKKRDYNAAQTRQLTRKGKTVIVIALCVVLLAVVAVSFLTRYLDWAKLQNYPFEYGDDIKRYSADYALDPALVAAVIYCESTYRPNAVSSAGARGLMQIMPDTGEWIAGKLNESASYTDDRLFEPELNIRYGCWYLNYLTGRFNGDMTNLLAAYNAGPGRVSDWLGQSEYSKDGQTLSDIPYRETRKYVKKVKAAHDIYLEMYFTGK